MKHFEDVWEEAEAISAERDLHRSADEMVESCKALSEEVGDGDPERMKPLVGETLFHMTRICQEFGINSWTALEAFINDAKIELYSKGEDSGLDD